MNNMTHIEHTSRPVGSVGVHWALFFIDIRDTAKMDSQNYGASQTDLYHKEEYPGHWGSCWVLWSAGLGPYTSKPNTWCQLQARVFWIQISWSCYYHGIVSTTRCCSKYVIAASFTLLHIPTSLDDLGSDVTNQVYYHLVTINLRVWIAEQSNMSMMDEARCNDTT